MKQGVNVQEPHGRGDLWEELDSENKWYTSAFIKGSELQICWAECVLIDCISSLTKADRCTVTSPSLLVVSLIFLALHLYRVCECIFLSLSLLPLTSHTPSFPSSLPCFLYFISNHGVISISGVSTKTPGSQLENRDRILILMDER